MQNFDRQSFISDTTNFCGTSHLFIYNKNIEYSLICCMRHPSEIDLYKNFLNCIGEPNSINHLSFYGVQEILPTLSNNLGVVYDPRAVFKKATKFIQNAANIYTKNFKWNANKSY